MPSFQSLVAPVLFVAHLAAHVHAKTLPAPFRYTSEKVLIDIPALSNLTRYSAFPRGAALLAVNTTTCYGPMGYIIDAYIDNTATDTQLALFRNDGRHELVLGIPGSNSSQDFKTDILFSKVPYVGADIACPGCSVHHSFLAAWNSVEADVKAMLGKAVSLYPTYDVVISGHSLGGAIGQLAFNSLRAAGTYRIVSAYSTGQPRVGNQAFADYCDVLANATFEDAGIYHRITHFDDGVPQLPPKIFGFVHPRTEYWQSSNDSVRLSTDSVYRCFGQEPTDCNDSTDGGGTEYAHSTYLGLSETTIGLNCQEGAVF